MKLCKKLGRKCSEGCYKRKTKIDELKADKKALTKRLRRSQGKVRALESIVGRIKSEKEEEDNPRNFETRETETI